MIGSLGAGMRRREFIGLIGTAALRHCVKIR